MLAAAFGDEVVVLDDDGARLLWLDAVAARVWGACEGVPAGAIAAAAKETPERVAETLQSLMASGLVKRAGTGWIRAELEWL